MHQHQAAKDIERINEILSAVGRLDDINDLRLGAEGAAKLRFAGGKEVFFEYCLNSGKFFIYTPILPIPLDDHKRCALMQRVLAANFLQLQSGEGYYAVAASQHSVVYQIHIPVSVLDVPLLDKNIDVLLQRHDEAIALLESPEGKSRNVSSASRNKFLQRTIAVAANKVRA